VLKACPSREWRLIFLLSRFGGLRCPSEHLALRWEDIDWGRCRIVVRSEKTAGQGKADRVIPIFPEIHDDLLAEFNEAEDGADFVFANRRMSSGNLRPQATRIIERAGLIPWPRLFQNLRASRATELASEHPSHVVAK
jgi:integrase